MSTNNSPVKPWTRLRALALMAICLTAGIAGGWIIQGTRASTKTESAKVAVASAQGATGANLASEAPGPDQLKSMADNAAAPLIAKLNANPKDTASLVSIGNIYYDARQYTVAVDYYGRALTTKPSDAAVRTDMATAYWYLGDADKAIAEFNTALRDAPTNPNTLFNLGLVKWQGKHDGAGAIADWKKLLATDPDYAGKDQLEKMMSDVEAQARKHGAKN